MQLRAELDTAAPGAQRCLPMRFSRQAQLAEAIQDSGFACSSLETGEAAALHLQIGGMTCSTCSGAVESALRGTPGVTEAAVNLLTNKAEVRSEPLPCRRVCAVKGCPPPWLWTILVLAQPSQACYRCMLRSMHHPVATQRKATAPAGAVRPRQGGPPPAHRCGERARLLGDPAGRRQPRGRLPAAGEGKAGGWERLW